MCSEDEHLPVLFSISLSTANVNDILYAADKYMLRQAKTSCSELLKESACSSNATIALLLEAALCAQKMNIYLCCFLYMQDLFHAVPKDQIDRQLGER
jgi:hypothetical protein